jgi:energy-coupling factor transport system ATP-binding protein
LTLRQGSVPQAPTPSHPPGPAVIEIEQLEYSYGGRDPALRGVDLSVHAGEMLAILGRNGAGKTSLIKHLIGLLQPDRGRAVVHGQDVAQTPTHTLARQLGFCFQNPNHQLVTFKVRDEIAFGLRAHQIDPSEYEPRTREALAAVGMAGAESMEIFDLGKGQRQRLALASVLALRPQVLVIDEPTTGQDPRMAQEIFDILKRLNGQGTTVIVVTHKVDLAAAYCSRAVVMADGRIAFDGSFPELLADAERMRAWSLEPPETTRLAALLAPYGVPPWLSTFDELSDALHTLVDRTDGD